MGVGILMSPSSKVQMRGGLPGRGGGGREGGYWSLDLSDALKPNYESERGKFLIDFSSFFLLWHNNNTPLPSPYYVKKKERKNFIHMEI